MADQEQPQPAGAPSDDQLKAQWHWNMTNHAPSPEAIRKIEALRSSAMALADAFIDIAPHSRERSLALTNLESALFYINAAVARNEPAKRQEDHSGESKSETKSEEEKK